MTNKFFFPTWSQDRCFPLPPPFLVENVPLAVLVDLLHLCSNSRTKHGVCGFSRAPICCPVFSVLRLPAQLSLRSTARKRRLISDFRLLPFFVSYSFFESVIKAPFSSQKLVMRFLSLRGVDVSGF